MRTAFAAATRRQEAGSLRRIGPADLSPPRSVAQALRELASQRYFMTEHYGADGEIVEAWEGHELDPGWEGANSLIITCYGFSEPRTDWRERGIIPPRGFHRSRWRE